MNKQVSCKIATFGQHLCKNLYELLGIVYKKYTNGIKKRKDFFYHREYRFAEGRTSTSVFRQITVTTH